MTNTKNNCAINVYSEIGKLRTVMLHRPGYEISNLTPSNLERLLFDDTPDLKVAQKEHDFFAETLRKIGVEVLYVEKLLGDLLKNKEYKNSFLDKYMAESDVKPEYADKARKYLDELSGNKLADKLISGITKFELGIDSNTEDSLVIDPMPNILFQRDPFSSIGNGVSINKMFTVTRKRETLLLDAIFKDHPRFKEHTNYWYERTNKFHIEGGDICMLSKKAIIVGCSERTEMDAIRLLAKNLFADPTVGIEKVIALELKVKNRAFMHLDTVFTNIDKTKFLAHPLIFENMDQFKITEITKDGENPVNKTIVDYLSDLLGKKITIIKCGGDNPINQAREQWNDGTNVLAVKPGEVIAYSRNHITVELLKKNGIKVHLIEDSELSRGRGGPRCMSMPIYREDI